MSGSKDEKITKKKIVMEGNKKTGAFTKMKGGRNVRGNKFSRLLDSSATVERGQLESLNDYHFSANRTSWRGRSNPQEQGVGFARI